MSIFPFLVVKLLIPFFRLAVVARFNLKNLVEFLDVSLLCVNYVSIRDVAHLVSLK